MSFFLPNKLNPQGQRLLTIIIALPVFVSTSYILYKRVVLEQDVHRPTPRNQLPSTNDFLAQYEKDLEKERQQQEASPSPSSSS